MSAAVDVDTSDRLVDPARVTNVYGETFVDGARVPGGWKIDSVPYRPKSMMTCQGPCKRVTIEVDLALYVRFETALDRLMYWWGLGPGPRPTRCAECRKP